MHIKGWNYALAASALLFLAPPLVADRGMPYHGLSEEERAEVRQQWDSMTPEERQALQQRARDYWAGLSDEERAAKREELRQYHSRGGRSRAHGEFHNLTGEERAADRQQLRERWEAMTPEEREAHRAMMRDHRRDQGYGYGKDRKDKEPSGD
jgi:hypothetical protein